MPQPRRSQIDTVKTALHDLDVAGAEHDRDCPEYRRAFAVAEAACRNASPAELDCARAEHDAEDHPQKAVGN